MKKINSINGIEIGKAASKFLGEMFDEIYLVGGAIRDELLNRQTNDLDYALPDSPPEVIKRLKSVGLQARDDAIEFGTIATKIGVFDIQITTYRDEVYEAKNRKPTVKPLRDIDSDLSRRDFTINAMAASRFDFIDPYGGLSDLQERIIRTVGDPELRFKEDPLRILRAYRFISQLGFALDEKTLLAAHSNSPLIVNISRARIGNELSKIIEGDYWADALIEIADSEVLTYIFNEETNSAITAEIVESYLAEYSLTQLHDLDNASRWAILLSIVSESRTGKTALPRKNLSFIDSTVNNLELGKSIIPLIEKSYESIQKSRHTLDAREVRIERLRSELDENLIHKDLKHNFIQSDLLLEYAREDFNRRNFNVARLKLIESLSLLDENFMHLLETSSAETRTSKITKYRINYFDRYKYLLACIIQAEDILDKHTQVEDIKKICLRKAAIKSPFAINDRDWSLLIEEALVLVLRNPIRAYKIGSLDEFISEISTHLSAERKYHLLKNYFYRIARSSESSISNKLEAYGKVLRLLLDNNIPAESEEYMMTKLDFDIWECLSATSIKEFWKHYDTLDKTATKVLHSDMYDSVKKSYLASSSALIHGLSLSEAVSEKYEISLMIVSHYLMSGTPAGKRNAQRFRIYVDWFKILSKITNLKNIKDLPEALLELRSLKSLGYIDDDESYFTKNLTDLSSTRNKISYVISFLNYLAGNIKSYEYPEEASLNSISTLLDTGLLKYQDSLAILKNWCNTQALSSTEGIELESIRQNLHDDTEPLEYKSENIALIEAGESEQVEFKASFRYSVQAKMLDKTGDIPFSSIKTIAAFLNTTGGTLFIGVSDNLEILGLENSDFKVLKQEDPVQKKVDSVKLNIDEMLNTHIGSQHVSYINISWEQYHEKTFIVVKVAPAQTPVFCSGEKFFVRTSSSSRELKGQEMLQYISEHYK